MNTPTLTRLRARHRARQAGAAGFTLLELVLVAVISSIMFLLIIRWILALGAASSLTLDNAGTQRTADITRDAFATDIAAAQACAPDAASPLRSIAPDQVSFTAADPSTPGQTVQITWSITAVGGGYAVTRTQAASAGSSSDPCLYGAASTKTYAESASGIQSARILAGDQTLRPGFYTVAQGQSVTDVDQAWGDCTKHEDALRCQASAIGVNWLFRSAGDGAAPIGVGRTFAFTTNGKGLS